MPIGISESVAVSRSQNPVPHPSFLAWVGFLFGYQERQSAPLSLNPHVRCGGLLVRIFFQHGVKAFEFLARGDVNQSGSRGRSSMGSGFDTRGSLAMWHRESFLPVLWPL
jgi:hypothetical protein